VGALKVFPITYDLELIIHIMYSLEVQEQQHPPLGDGLKITQCYCPWMQSCVQPTSQWAKTNI
jgi:hypothetical protein